ncbi:MAG: substrate-binding domain-containing protein [Lacipirellulaceae bacterium]
MSLRLATTTSTRDSGLLDELLPAFEKQHNVRVDVIATGTGKALKLGEAGDVDVVLVHARAAEEAFMETGHGIRREDVMANTFEIVCPTDDPADVKGSRPSEALRKIAATKTKFLSRGDDSGTHKRELQLWKNAGGLTPWSEYIETGQGMGATLTIADEMQGYALTDRGTYLRFKSKVDLVPLISGSPEEIPEMANPYGVIVVNPRKSDAINAKLANAFIDYLISDTAQQKIAKFQVEGEALFSPVRQPTADSR